MTTSPQALSAAVRVALTELETQRSRLREIRDLTLGNDGHAAVARATTGATEAGMSSVVLEKVFEHTVGLTLERLNRVIVGLEEALDSRGYPRPS